MNSIPNWFFRLREAAYEALHEYKYRPIDANLCAKVEEATNKVIKESPYPILHEGKEVTGIQVCLGMNGHVTIQLLH